MTCTAGKLRTKILGVNPSLQIQSPVLLLFQEQRASDTGKGNPISDLSLKLTSTKTQRTEKPPVIAGIF